MASQFFSSLLSGRIIGPQSLINAGGPLPSIPGSAPAQYHAVPDGKINPPDQSRLLQGGLQDFIYSYGPNPSRLTTQTQMNIPNKIQLIIPKIFIPAAVSDGSAYQDPILEHSITDGDLVFSLKMNREMVGMGSQSYIIYPQGYTDRAVKLINLATVNYILWGLQVGVKGGRRWKNFFSHLCKSKVPSFAVDEDDDQGELSYETIWNFIKTYLAPYGVQHGSDMQGGQHEGSKSRVVSTNATDYVSSFAVEGKILKMNNLWRAYDVNENDDLVLALRYMPPQQSNIQFVLSSSNRSTRNERAPVHRGWWYLNAEVLEYKTLIDTPHIHVARSQKMISSFTQNSFGMDMPSWNARAAMHGPPLQVTLEPSFVESDVMWFRDTLSECSQVKSKPDREQQQTTEKNNSDQPMQEGASTDHANNNLLNLQHAYCTPGFNGRKNNSMRSMMMEEQECAKNDTKNENEASSSSQFTKIMLHGAGKKRASISEEEEPTPAAAPKKKKTVTIAQPPPPPAEE